MRSMTFLFCMFSLALFFLRPETSGESIYLRGKLSKNRASQFRELSSLEELQRCDFSFDKDFLNREVAKYEVENINQYVTFSQRAANVMYLSEEEFLKCKSISCLYEAVYKKTGMSLERASEVGHKAAIYFLKTDAVLVATKKHRFSGGEGELSEHLFNENEIDAFWRLTYAYPDKVMRILKVKFLYRVRNGFTIIGKEKAGAFTSSGYITFQDGGLTTGRSYPDYIMSTQKGAIGAAPYSYIYQAALHERGHNIHWWDNFHSLRHENLTWMQVSGVNKVESFANTTYTKNEISTQGTVRDYGKEDWMENFAELIAYYRLNPVQQKRLALPSYNFVKEHVFDGREYTEKGDKDAFTKTLQARVMSKNFTACTQQKKVGEERELSECVLNMVESYLNQATVQTSHESPEFCYVEKNFVDEVKSDARKKIIGLLKSTVFFAEEYQDFVDRFFEKYDLTAFAIAAANNGQGRSFFQEEVRKYFFDETKNVFTKDLQTKAWERFESQISYTVLLDEARKHYKRLLYSDLRLQNYAKNLWQRCLNEETVYVVNQSDFKTQFSYVDQNFENCLSQKIDVSIDEAFDESWNSVETDSYDELRKGMVRKLLHSMMQSVFFVHLEQNEKVQYAIEQDFLKTFLSELDAQDSIEEIKKTAAQAQEGRRLIFFDLEAEVIKRSDSVLQSLLKERMLTRAQNSYACLSLVVRIHLELKYSELVAKLADELNLNGRIDHLLEQTVKRSLVVEVANKYIEGGCTAVQSQN